MAKVKTPHKCHIGKERVKGLSKAIWMRWLLVCQSLVSHFYVRIDFSENEFN
jgi:hypothetical protein